MRFGTDQNIKIPLFFLQGAMTLIYSLSHYAHMKDEQVQSRSIVRTDICFTLHALFVASPVIFLSTYSYNIRPNFAVSLSVCLSLLSGFKVLKSALHPE
jgi:hypothetical protein